MRTGSSIKFRILIARRSIWPFLPLLNSGRVGLLDIPRMLTSSPRWSGGRRGLGRILSIIRPGRTTMLSNAAAGGLVLAARRAPEVVLTGPIVVKLGALRLGAGGEERAPHLSDGPAYRSGGGMFRTGR